MNARYAIVAVLAVPAAVHAAPNQVLGWNNLGMHCMDSDYSVFSILPPYNTVEAQLIVGGRLVTNAAGYSVTYQAVADPDGSLNSTARGKGNFYDYVLPLYGAAVSPEAGLTAWPMPGTNNVPQGMLFEPTNRPAAGASAPVNWFRAEGIPISPFDDAGRKNPYPMMRLIARNSGGTALATNDVVLPVSDEMDCRTCHASGTDAAARPSAGWVWSSKPERDFRLNILRLHDDRQFAAHATVYGAALGAGGFNPRGLYRGVAADGHPVLCAKCHASEALGTASYSNIPPLTASVHSRHATVTDPDLHVPLDSATHRGACYRCHPGSTTRCLRGAMGGAVAADGSLEMQCQSCHGTLSRVGAADRVGWFMEPDCQSCHTGTATSNGGQIRFVSCFDSNGTVRAVSNRTFATTLDTPAPGLSLYRFSRGHGGLQCSACHGSTHAEFPSTHRNDNRRNEVIQGHAGVMVECTSCHVSMSVSSSTAAGGPHGLHPLGQGWVDSHPDMLEGGSVTRAQCQACHGVTYRGSVLGRGQGSRTVTSKFGSRTYWRGRQVGCYDCHDGAHSSDPSANTAPVVSSVATSTVSGASVAMTLPGADANGNPLVFRVVSQPGHGTVGVASNRATYFAEAGYTGTVTFAFAANDGTADSNLATGSVAVTQGSFVLSAVAHVPADWPAGWPAPFGAVAAPGNTAAAVSYDWDFGDGSPHGAAANSSHAYAAPGPYAWTLIVAASTASVTVAGTIAITNAPALGIAAADDAVQLTWAGAASAAVLEETPSMSPPVWSPSTHDVQFGPSELRIAVPLSTTNGFYRLRLVE